MSDLQDTLTELKAVITYLKTKADSGSGWAGTEKADVEKRIAHLNDKSKPRHTNLTADLKLDTQDLDNLETMIGQDKTAWALEKSKLEKAKKDAETERDNKNTIISDKEKEIKEQKEKIADKITTDLITKLESVANSTPADQTTKLTEIKTIIDELKTKGAKADLTDITAKVDALTTTAKNIKEATEKIKPSSIDGGTNYWSIGACIGAGIAIVLLIYVAFVKPSNNKSESIYSSKEEIEE